MLGLRVLLFIQAVFVIVCLSSCFCNESPNTLMEQPNVWEQNVDTLDDVTAVRKIRGFRKGGLGLRIFSKKPGNNNRKGQTPPGQSYHPPPQTKDITGIPGLESQKRKTPVQGGGGLRSRWQDSKGKNVYEWDSRHGELEKYRKSDGKHMGSFDPKTGNQNKVPDPKKNMDKKNM
ncbi:colicin-E6-like [Nasonia vitripennis]|uniref:Colicin E3-like ribonuclease domain-containing protein n=1 Tax=Nasonia vitripennis TaxID=7425 RepID=A0A7M7QIC8_NASVI|nr:colicin-E6-like [Nasonia vitripennis]